MASKLKDSDKMDRVKKLINQALFNLEHNRKDKNMIAGVTRNLCQAYAWLQMDKDDEFMFTNLWLQIELKVNGIEQAHLPGFDVQPGNDYELKPKGVKK